jgi:adenosylcobinamide amidohydrolase
VPPDSLSTVKGPAQKINHKTGKLVEQAIIEAKEDFKKQAEERRGEDNDYI